MSARAVLARQELSGRLANPPVAPRTEPPRPAALKLAEFDPVIRRAVAAS